MHFKTMTAILYDTLWIWFPSLWSQCPTPVLPTSAVLASYILCPRCQFCLSMSFPVFFPLTQTRFKCAFHFLVCLSSTVARTPEHPCSLFLCSCLLMQRHSGTSPSVPGRIYKPSFLLLYFSYGPNFYYHYCCC